MTAAGRRDDSLAEAPSGYFYPNHIRVRSESWQLRKWVSKDEERTSENLLDSPLYSQASE